MESIAQKCKIPNVWSRCDDITLVQAINLAAQKLEMVILKQIKWINLICPVNGITTPTQKHGECLKVRKSAALVSLSTS